MSILVERFQLFERKMPTSTLDARTRVFSFAKAKNTTVAQKIKEAISAVGDGNENKGASVSAIVTWILSNYSIMDPNQLKIQVKKSVIKLLEKGDLQRSWTSKGALGSSGSFVLPKERVKKTNYMNSNSRAQMKKSITLKANTIRESKKFPKIRESGIKADKFSVSEFQKLLEKQT
nr:uncharacterized protein LOC107441389 isoform X1 [Parasteatoda tepidariorum]